MFLGVLAGTLSPVQTSINAELRDAIHAPLAAAFNSFFVGTIVLILLISILERRRLFRKDVIRKGKEIISKSPKWIWIGGLLGAIFVSANIFLLPVVGAALTVVLTFCGQMVIALIIDHFGWFHVPKRRVNVMRVVGMILMVAGIFFIQHF
ncbi:MULTISPECIES: DMT family transporter [unclassified Sporolactobacillus]|uniref:DMT family transporter n=1 Tax=Sporolactobacillus sp. KGMB 08714 TaxID=3064704 RepID=UPI002367F912|nr:DMT family transporter [Sporolactobacillus sp. CQH2019]MDD9150237.1 DMT family transporter [Sporolactobacillus sp. CQH2019]